MNSVGMKLNTFKLDQTNWEVIVNENFSPLLAENDQLKSLASDKLKQYINSEFSDFRVQLNFYGVSLLCAYFFEEKVIRVASSRLNSEMFLIQGKQTLSTFDIDQSDDEIFCEYKKHAEKIASLSLKHFPSVYEQVTHVEGLVDLLDSEATSELGLAKVESKAGGLIEALLVKVNSYSPSLFEKISDFGLNLTANYALLRVHMLKFLAILPSLDHDTQGIEVKRILLESLRRLIKDSKKAKRLKKKGQEKALPSSYIIAVYFKFIFFKLIPSKPLAQFVRFSVRLMAKRFIAGETIETAEKSIKELALTGRDVTLDQLGELVVSEKEADHYCNEVIKLIKGFSLHVKKGDKNSAGVNRAHVSIKVSALCSDFKPQSFDYTYKLVAPRLKKILLCAKDEDVFINIDAEHYDYRDIVFKVYKKVLLETPELSDYKATGIVIQAYLRDGHTHLKEVIDLAKERGHTMPIRLVKGAYWDAETVEADAHNFNAPEFLNKEETDLHFRQMIFEIFKSSPHIQLCIASHNFSDHCFSEALRSELYPDALPIEHQCLHMTYEALSTAMAKMGWPVRNYVPIGSLLVGMAYLVRRIMENSSQVGVLTIMRSHKKNISLQSPEQVHSENKKNGTLTHDQTVSGLTSQFFNVTPLRSYLDDQRVWLENSLSDFKAQFDKLYSNDFKVSGEEVSILSSSDPSLNVGKIQFATKEDAIKAVEIVDQSYNSGEWAKTSWINRASILVRASEIMLSRRNELSALISYEAGKALDESLADVDEAIDFLNFYAREEGRYHKHSKEVLSRGATAVIAPWNFPLAIPCGMAVSSLVAGNTVILKSAEQTPLIAQELVNILHLAGVPKNVLIHLPGLGEIVGNELIHHERISSIVFTGSKAVGKIIEKAARARVYENKLHKLSYPVSIITEMGGKNATIVTANAELDETVSGILYSAFAHAGQKCSACSRVIVDNSVKDKLVARLKEAASDIEVGVAWNYSTAINPLITKEDKERVQRQVIEATEEVTKLGGKVVIDRTKEELPGYCVGPAIFEVPFTRALAKDSFSQIELFAPVVHIVGVDGLDQALQVYNSTEYALTGGVFSQSQDDIDYLCAKMENGNIYVNRTITGARVGIEPFGGFKLSGTGPKAGGKGYLPSFHVSRPSLGLSVEQEIEGDSNYNFDLSRQSKLALDSRFNRFLSAIVEIESNFESIFMGIYGQEKDVVKSFHKWLRNNGQEFITKHHQNKKIPGQLSYNDFTMTQEGAVLVSYNDRPELLTFIDALTAIALGVGLTVVSRNHKSYAWWKGIQDICLASGLSRHNFDVFLSDKENLERAIQNENIETIIVDGSLARVQEVNDLLAHSKLPSKHMKKVHSQYDGPAVDDFKRIASRYICVRSFAVNVMRHGAPLELDI